MDLDGAIAEFVESRTIPIFGIANVQGFADALPGWHPKELMPIAIKMSERSGIKAKICCHCFNVCPWSMGRLGNKGLSTKTEEV